MGAPLQEPGPLLPPPSRGLSCLGCGTTTGTDPTPMGPLHQGASALRLWRAGWDPEENQGHSL